MKIIFAATLSLALQGVAFAADIKFIPASESITSSVSISGPIVKGDYEKFVNAVFDDRTVTHPVRQVFLADSPGGNINEALAIGRLAGALHLKGFVVGDCYSACAFIALGLKTRVFLGRIGLHRPYYDAKYYSKLSPFEADDWYRSLHNETRRYLKENYVRETIVDTIFSTPSDNILIYSGTLSEKTFGQTQPQLYELIQSRCKNGGRQDEILEGTKCFAVQLKAIQNDALKHMLSLAE